MSLEHHQKELIQRSFVETLNEVEARQLNDLLRRSKEAREHYQKAAALDSMLRDQSETFEFDASEPQQTSFLLWKIAALFFMCISIVLAVVTISNLETPEEELVVQENSLALIQHAVNLNKDDALNISEGKALSEGSFKIEQGMVQIDFISGVSLIGEGPLDLELINDMEVHCKHGKVRVRVPPQATGFKLHTPDTQVLDLGTEFGVAVTKDGSDISVIDGKIELYNEEKKEAELTDGQQMKVIQQQYQTTSEKTYTPSPLDLALALEERALAKNKFWLNSLATIREDSQLVLYYDFRKKDPWGKTLKNVMAPNKSLSYGAIVGADWTDGRLGPDTALEFKGHHNFIRLEENTVYDSISLLTWVRIDSLDVSLSSLLHSDNWQDKGVHWHISNQGVLTLGIKSKFGEDTIIRSPKGTIANHHIGKWIMIVSTYDGPNGTMEQYIDGQLVDARTDLKTYPGQIGKAQIGGWLTGNKQSGRGLNGLMDRFAVWSKALTSDEIKQMYLEGNPISQLALTP